MRYRLWMIFLAVGGTVTLFTAALGTDAQAVATIAMGLAVTPVGLRVLRAREPDVRVPWTYFSIAGAGIWLAGTLRVALHAIDSSIGLYPSPADAMVAVAYAALIAGTYKMGSIRSGRNRGAHLDGLIVAIAAATVVWSLVLWPYMVDSTTPLVNRLVNAGFSILATILLAATIRLAVGPGNRTVSYYILALGVLLVFVTDLTATFASIDGRRSTLSLLAGPMIYALYGAAALHPEMPRMFEPPSNRVLQLTRKRITLLAAGLLVPPITLIWSGMIGIEVNVPVAAVGSALLAIVVLARFRLLVRAQEETAERQRIHQETNAHLAASSGRHAMYRAALQGMLDLAGNTSDQRVAMAQVDGQALRVLDATGHRGHDAIGTTISMADLPSDLLDGLAGLSLASTTITEPIDLETSGTPSGELHVLIAPLRSQNNLSGALILTDIRSASPTVRESIGTLASTVSLALESAVLSENLMRRRSERRFRALVENSSDVVLVLDEGLAITFASPASQRLLGLAEKSLLGTHPARWIHPEDWHGLAKILTATKHGHARGGGPSNPAPGVEVRIGHVDGSYRWFEVRTSNLSHDPEIRGIVLTAREVSDRKATEQRLAASEARFRALVHSSSDIVAVVANDGCFTYISPAITEMLGYQPYELEGTSALGLMEPDSIEVFLNEYPELSLPLAPNERLVHNRIEVQLSHRNGEPRIVDVTINDLRTDPAIGGVVLNARDVTVRKALEADLRFQALHDALTGLPNRTMFTQQTAMAIRGSAPAQPVGALFIDLDDFKTVNDSLGHAVGDELLQEVARRLVQALPDEDLAARLGGDEFAVLVVDASDEAGVVAMAEEVLVVIAQPCRIQGREIQVSASIGIAFATDDLEADAEVLLRSADVAMYLAKDRGKNRFAIFEAHMHASVFERLELKADLVRAIDDGQLRVHYQPIVSLRTGRITGVEALVRWEHPIRGWLTPDSFIPLAEDTGLVIPLGRWVLREACQQLRTWQLNLPSNETITMSVNLSVRQLADDDLVRDVQEAIEDAALDPSTLTLEITETTLMHDTELARLRLIELRRLGLSLAVDDFGTGYSSLQYVQRFPIDAIKIDRSFVTGLGTTLSDGALVQSMIELSQRLGVHTVAEGIERPEQVRILQSLGADLGQGYLFAKPMAADQIDELLIGHPNGQPHFLLA